MKTGNRIFHNPSQIVSNVDYLVIPTRSVWKCLCKFILDWCVAWIQLRSWNQRRNSVAQSLFLCYRVKQRAISVCKLRPQKQIARGELKENHKGYSINIYSPFSGVSSYWMHLGNLIFGVRLYSIRAFSWCTRHGGAG